MLELKPLEISNWKPLKNKNIVVTGGAGLLGSHVVRLLLERGNDVVVLDDFSNGKTMHLRPYEQNHQLNIIRGDITNINDVKEAFEDCQIVIHLAVLDLRQSIKEPQRVNEVIVDGTLNCLEAALENNIELFLNCSSGGVYGTATYVPMDENHPVSASAPYTAAKMAQDMQNRMGKVTAAQQEYIDTLRALAGESDVASESLRELLPEEFKRLPPGVGAVEEFAGTILDPQFDNMDTMPRTKTPILQIHPSIRPKALISNFAILTSFKQL